MAATQQENSSRNSLIECAICMETLKNPKCLPCIHTFCLRCLESLGKSKRPGDAIACPLCRKLFKIPQQGFAELPHNFFIQEILNDCTRTSVEHGGFQENKRTCDACNEPSSVYCVQCDQHFCTACTVSHSKIRASACHKVISLEEMESSPLLSKTRPRFCETHKDKPLELYCYDCKLVICLMCSVIKHKQHNCNELEEV